MNKRIMGRSRIGGSYISNDAITDLIEDNDCSDNIPSIYGLIAGVRDTWNMTMVRVAGGDNMRKNKEIMYGIGKSDTKQPTLKDNIIRGMNPNRIMDRHYYRYILSIEPIRSVNLVEYE